LFGQPTLVNNIETLANVLPIIVGGGAAFAATGVSGSPGTKLFCLSGCVDRPGLYELPFGATLRDLVKRSGGVRGGRPIRAILIGGAAGNFVDPEHLDVPLTFAGLSAIGASLGSGAVVVFDDSVDMPAIVARIAEFFRDESCGQCVPCRVGTVRQEEALQRLIHGPLDGQVGLLNEIAAVMRDGSICGLGQTAASAVQSAVALGLVGGAT
jgi:NADH-quinone oxidoreductase subunit F